MREEGNSHEFHYAGASFVEELVRVSISLPRREEGNSHEFHYAEVFVEELVRVSVSLPARGKEILTNSTTRKRLLRT